MFPVHGCALVVAGYLSARTPREADAAWAIEPGGALALRQVVVPYVCSDGSAVGPPRDERCDADCVDDFLSALESRDDWRAVGAQPVDASTLPGGAHLEGADEPAFFLLTDDGRGADVVLGMSFWRAGSTYAEGCVATWARPAGEESVRVVGVRLARVDGEAPLVGASRVDDLFTRRSLRQMPLWFVGMLAVANLYELRVFGELGAALVLPAWILLLRSLFREIDAPL